MPQKVCPRCGSQFATLKSATCPNCFAKLVEVDDDTAAEMMAARIQVEQTPEFQEVKTVEDEKFRHQSFQACLGVVVLTVATLAISIFAIVNGRQRMAAHRPRPAASMHALPPAVQARVEDVMPPVVGAFKRAKMDAQPAVSGTLALIYHGAYSSGADTAPIDVYAVALDRPAAEQSHFRDLVHLLANAGTAQRPIVEVSAKPFLYEIVGPASGNVTATAPPELDAFRTAWTTLVGGNGKQ